MSSERKLETTKDEASQSWLGHQKENIRIVLIALVVAILLRTFVIEPRFIPSSSMEPTLQINDRVVVEKISYRFEQPKRGEIVVFYPPASPAIEDNSKAYIKRIIGLPGDRINIHDGKVFVNDQPLSEAYIAEPPDYVSPPQGRRAPADKPSAYKSVTVPANRYWVMGDNRNYSNDSHVWGFLPKGNIIGRAMFRFWPLDKRFGELKTPNYRQ